MHVEGAVIQTIFLLLFFDIIYQVSPPGVFQSPYQAAPLDLYSKLFYENRKDAIDTRLIDMISWSQEELMQRIRLVYYDNFNVNCVVSWNDDLKPELYCVSFFFFFFFLLKQRQKLIPLVVLGYHSVYRRGAPCSHNATPSRKF